MLNRVRRDHAENPPKMLDRQDLFRLLLLVAVTAVVFAVYRCLMIFPYFEWVLIAYMLLCTGFVSAYVIYNRGFPRKGLTGEVLPNEWNEEEKQTFLEDAARRAKRSRWMIIPIFAFLFTFAFEVMELFVVPFFSNFFVK